MSYRPATIHDATWIHERRRIEETNPWANHKNTTFNSHINWLHQRLNNPLVKLLVWEERNVPQGLLRIDSNGELAYYARNDNIAQRMLTAARVYAGHYGGRLKANVDTADDTKVKQLNRAGFKTAEVTYLDYRP